MAFARRFGKSYLQRARSLRAAGPGRPSPPTRLRTRFGGRTNYVSMIRARRHARGGFFKDVFKGVKKIVNTVTKVPVIGTVAKVAVGSLPIVGQVTTAVNAFKKKTPVGIAASPVGGVPMAAVAGAAPVSVAPPTARAPRRKRRKATTKRKATKRKAKSGGGSAKQRAARARFAAAARKGKIKKGQRL